MIWPGFSPRLRDLHLRLHSYLAQPLRLRTSLAILILVDVLAAVAIASVGGLLLQQQNSILQSSNKDLSTKLETADYQNQIFQTEKTKLDEEKKQLDAKVKSNRLSAIDSVYTLYTQVLGQIKRNADAKLDVSSVNSQTSTWGAEFLAQQFDQLTAQLNTAAKTLDDQYNQYLAALPKPPPPPPAPSPSGNSSSANGYSYQTVSTSRGTFGVYLIKLPLSQYAVKTLTANSSDCTNNCPTQSLAAYIQQNGAYAGMNGTYLCPPDYASCAGKTNSYDWPVYNSNLGYWLNKGALSWTSIGLATFNGGTPHFYRYNNQYSGASVTAAISNFPILLLGGNIVNSSSEQTAYQQLKGTKGSIGTDGTNVYLALVSNANVDDSAYVLQALGEKDALNLDGGGTSAMYINGSYKVGPGRSLPNAVVLVHR